MKKLFKLFALLASVAVLTACGGTETSTPTDSPEASPTESSEAFPTESSEASPTESSEAFPTESSEAFPTESPEAFPTESSEAFPTESPEATTSLETLTAVKLIPVAVFKEIDINQQGEITQVQFVEYFAVKKKELTKEDAEKNFQELDKDGTGTLTKEEATGEK